MSAPKSVIAVGTVAAHVATVTLCRPPDNFFDGEMLGAIADALESFAVDGDTRAVILGSRGRHFCAGAVLGAGPLNIDAIYEPAARIFATPLPIIAAVQGAAVGGGLGLALAADFRVGTAESRFSANFARLGFHHGFGLSVTLPAVVGQQRALEMLLTGRRVRGEEAHTIGLIDRLVAPDELEGAAVALASEVAASAPLACAAIRATMRGDLVERFRAALSIETSKQLALRDSADFAEGVLAMRERRTPHFTGS